MGHEATVAAWIAHREAAEIVRHVSRVLDGDGWLMPLKGTLVGRLYYPDPIQRPMSDCDLLFGGVPYDTVVSRLERDGFLHWRVPRVPKMACLVHPDHAIALDLHGTPLPPGYGAIGTDWMRRGAREDRDLFGVPVLVPEHARTLAVLLIHIVKDHLRARAELAVDVARLLEQTRDRLDEHAACLRAAGVAQAGWIALDWVAARVDSDDARRLADALRLGPVARCAARLRSRWLERAHDGGPSLGQRLVTRTVADDPRRWPEAVAGALLGYASSRWGRTARAIARREGQDAATSSIRAASSGSASRS